MKRTLLAAVLLAPIALTTPAAAHTGSHPFANCTEAREHGYSNIPRGDEHYAPKLDRDDDGWGCDKSGILANDGKAQTGGYAEKDVETAKPSEDNDEALAETGGDSRTPYVAGAAVILLAGGGYMVIRRRTNR